MVVAAVVAAMVVVTVMEEGAAAAAAAAAAEVCVLAARWGSVALARQAEHRGCLETRGRPGMRSRTETGMP
jgi:hypothetical protein